jgi:2-hydroxychromene-2-carboxylate isomerase
MTSDRQPAREPRIDFWFAIGSTYTYLTVMRMHEVARAAGVSVTWRPFSLRTLTREMNNIPFATKPFKAKYMWRDIERRAGMYGIPVRLPVPYPLKEFDLANLVALIGMQEGWGEAYVCATYRRWFQSGEEPGIEPNLSDSLKEAAQDPARVLRLAETNDALIAYQGNTNLARSLGIFGAPTFRVGGELFWGDDRLEDAFSWARLGAVRNA